MTTLFRFIELLDCRLQQQIMHKARHNALSINSVSVLQTSKVALSASSLTRKPYAGIIGSVARMAGPYQKTTEPFLAVQTGLAKQNSR